MDYVVTSS